MGKHARSHNSYLVKHAEYQPKVLEYTIFSAVVGSACTITSECTSKLSNTDCMTLQCACNTGYTGVACSGNLDGPVFIGRSILVM